MIGVSASGYAEVNGTRLYYDVSGDGPPLVLVHGRGLDRRMWDDQLAPLAERFRVIRYDVRAHGRSALPGETPFRHADDLRALLDRLGVERADVVGLSMGGRIAVEFALLYPAMTDRLVLLDASLDGFAFGDAWNASFDAIAATGRSDGPAAANEQWLAHDLFAPARASACRERLEKIARDSPGWIWAHSSPLIPFAPPAIERLGEIRSPTLVIVGEHDLPDFHRVADALAAGIPAARKVVVPGAGHMSNMERPAEVNAELLVFLRR